MSQNTPEIDESRQPTTDGAGSGAGTPQPTETWFLRPVLGSHRSVELTQQECENAVVAKVLIMKAVACEERFTILVDNYLDYEREIFDSGLGQLVRPFNTWHHHQPTRVVMNRRLLNFVASAKQYVDHLCKDLKVLAPGVEGEEIQAERRAQYEQKRGYRVMEELRIVVQHLDQGLHTISFPHDRQGSELRIRTVPMLGTAKLEPHMSKDAKPRAVLAELQAMGENVPLTPFVREYLEGLWAVHLKVRATTAARIQAADASIRALIERGHVLWGPQAAVTVSGRVGLELFDEVQLFGDFLDYCDRLRRRSDTLANVTRIFVSGQGG